MNKSLGKSAPQSSPGRNGAVGRRALPSVEKVLQRLGPLSLPRALVVLIIREQIAALRREAQIPEFDTILRQVCSACERLRRLRLQPVINGTGTLLHTNLGRAPLGSPVIQHLATIAANYNNLEYDLNEGGRGDRGCFVETSLAVLCEAEGAAIVNNCAAALVLVLRYFTKRKPEVIISRGELIQIGGGFRIPTILEASGARLREVGTTNKTSLEDYAGAMSAQSGLILKVHRSNFVMDGFVESPSTQALARLAREKHLTLVEDLGSGAVIDTEKVPGLEHEPTAAELLRQGVDLVTFSGDKLLGGPQCGIIVGKRKWIAGLKREPFFRALRCDKLVLAALEATVDAYLEGRPAQSLRLLTLLEATEEQLRARAEAMAAKLSDLPLAVCVTCSRAQIGGGSLPRSTIPSMSLELSLPNESPNELAARLRSGSPPVIGYISGGRFRLDLRTVFASQDAALAQAIRSACTYG